MLYTISNRPTRIEWEISREPMRTLQNAKNLLCVAKGEVPYSRYRGIDPAIYDMSMGKLNAVIAQEVRRAMMFEPDAEVKAVRTDMSEGYLIIEVDVEIDDELGEAGDNT